MASAKRLVAVIGRTIPLDRAEQAMLEEMLRVLSSEWPRAFVNPEIKSRLSQGAFPASVD